MFHNFGNSKDKISVLCQEFLELERVQKKVVLIQSLFRRRRAKKRFESSNCFPRINITVKIYLQPEFKKRNGIFRDIRKSEAIMITKLEAVVGVRMENSHL